MEQGSTSAQVDEAADIRFAENAHPAIARRCDEVLNKGFEPRRSASATGKRVVALIAVVAKGINQGICDGLCIIRAKIQAVPRLAHGLCHSSCSSPYCGWPTSSRLPGST